MFPKKLNIFSQMETILKLSLLLLGFFVANISAAAIIIDHNSVANFDNIPSQWIERAKTDLNLAYGHTSHGSQIVTGMTMLRNQNSLYNYTTGSSGFMRWVYEWGL